MSEWAGYASYKGYRKSPGYRRRREALIILAGSRCKRCAATTDLSIHHLHYDTLGHESPEDVEVLCRRCHGIEEITDQRHRSLDNWAFNKAQTEP